MQATQITIAMYLTFESRVQELAKAIEAGASKAKLLKLKAEIVAGVWGVEMAKLDVGVGVDIDEYLDQIIDQHIMLFEAYRPPVYGAEFRFEYQGQEYVVASGGVIDLQSIVEISAFNALPKGNDSVKAKYNETLNMVATLARVPGETFPISEVGFKAKVDERKKVFENLPYNNALDVVFFLANTVIQQNQTQG